MGQFIPTSDENVQRFLSVLRSQTPISEPGDFVRFYNSGMITRTNEDVKRLVELLVAAYKDVSVEGGISPKIVMISGAEVHLDESIGLLRDWLVVALLQRGVWKAIEANVINENSVLLLTPDARSKGRGGVLNVLKRVTNPETGEDEINFEDASLIFNRLNAREADFTVKHFGLDAGGYDFDIPEGSTLISVQGILDLDCSFADNLHVPELA